jgi:uncharacterized OsmC-like protein
MSEETKHTIVRLARGYEFVAEFPDLPDSPAMLLDEPQPLGDSRGPNAADVLAAAVGDCLAASFAFCVRKAQMKLDDLTADVVAHLSRNEKGRLRIDTIDVELKPRFRHLDQPRLERCEALFEDFCTVTASVRRGIPVTVSVKPPAQEDAFAARDTAVLPAG